MKHEGQMTIPKGCAIHSTPFVALIVEVIDCIFGLYKSLWRPIDVSIVFFLP